MNTYHSNQFTMLKPTPGSITAALAPPSCAELINAIEKTTYDTNAFEECLRSSAKHPNGFIRIQFEPTRYDRTQIRIHVWSISSPQEESQDIHSHAWDFASLVIDGEFQMDLYLDMAGKINATSALSRVRHRCILAGVEKGKRVYQLLNPEQTMLSAMGMMRFLPGSKYALGHESLHTFCCVAGTWGGITAIRRGQFLQRETLVYRVHRKRNLVPEDLPISARDLRYWLDKCKQAISKNLPKGEH